MNTVPFTPHEFSAEGPTHHFALGVGHRAQSLRRIGEALGIDTVIINLEK